MEHHGLKVAEGSEVTNLTAPTGTQFPANENTGELFFRTDEDKLYIYNNSSWTEVPTGSSNALANFQDNGSVGEVYYDHGGGGQTLRLSTSATGLTYTGLLEGTQARYEGTNAYIEFHDTDSGTSTLDHFRINQFGANLQIEAKDNSWAHVRNVANFTHAGNLELPVGNFIATSGGVTATSGAGAFQSISTVNAATVGTTLTATTSVAAPAFRADNTNLTGGFQMATNGGDHYAWAPEATAATLYSYTAEWSGTAERLISATKDAGVSLYFNNAVKVATTTTGATITGRADSTAFRADNTNLTGGFQMATNGGHHYAWAPEATAATLYSYSGEWSGTAERLISATKDAGVRLYHNNSEKLETTSTGIDVTGKIDVTGQIDMSNNTNITARNTGNSVDVPLIKLDSVNRVEVGGTTYSTEIHGGVVYLVDSGTTRLTTNSSGVDITGVFTADTMRLENAQFLVGRDAGNSAYLSLIRASSVNQVEVGNTTYQTEIHGSSVRLVDSGVDVLTTSGTNVDIPGSLTIGKWLLANSQFLYGRDAGNSADMPLIRADSVNRVEVGGTTYSTEIHGGTVYLIDSGTTRLTTSSSGVNITGIFTADTMRLANAQFLGGRDSGNSTDIPLIRADSVNRVEVGGTTYSTEIHGAVVYLIDSGTTRLTTSSSGVNITGIFTADTMRLANAQYLVARDQANSGDIDLIRVNTSNQINLGDSSNRIYMIGSQIFIGGNRYPTVTGTDGQVLTTNGSGTLSWTTVGGSSLTNFQDNGLAGEALYNSAVKLATTTDGVDVTGTLVATDLDISGKLKTATSFTTVEHGWLNMGYDGDGGNVGNSYIRMYGDNVGEYFTTANEVISSEGAYTLYAGAAGSDARLRALYTGGVELFYDGVVTLATTTNGVDITGELIAGGNAFPTNTGTDGYYLKTDGAGQASWAAVAAGSSLENFQDNAAVAEIYYDHGQGGETLIAATSATGFVITADTSIVGNLTVGVGMGSPSPDAIVEMLSSGLATNYDVRLSAEGGTSTDGEGKFVIDATETDVLGTLNVSTSDVSVLTIGDAIANTPEIQFQSGGAGADYDSRIYATGGTATEGEGSLYLDADAVEVSCDVSITGGDVKIDSIDKNLDLFTRKAMCHVEVGGSPSPLLINHFGVNSVTRNGAGDFSLTMTDSWADNNTARAKIYATVSRHYLSGGVCNVTRVDVSSVNQIDIIFQDATPANADPTYFSVTVEHIV